MEIHSLFDLLAVIAAVIVFRLVPMPAAGPAEPWRLHPLYLSVAALGMIAGALVAGTGNLWLSGLDELAKSVVGGLAGAILAIEILKWRTGVAGSTGLRFVAPLAAAIAVGRWGCFFAGIPDRTYGTASDLPWACDFGDGIPRHPVQLYESIAMTVFLVVFVVLLRRGYRVATRAGFYLFVGVYAGQRLLWEFLKPYGTVIGPFNLFHLICFALIVYAAIYATKELRHA